MNTEDKFLHNLRKSEKSQHQAPSHNAWDRIHKKMENKRSKRFFNRSLYWQGIAASFLLVCFVAVIYYFFNNSLNKKDITQAVPKQPELSVPFKDTTNHEIAGNTNNEVKKELSSNESTMPTATLKSTKQEANKPSIQKPINKPEESITDHSSKATGKINQAAAVAKEMPVTKQAAPAIQFKPETVTRSATLNIPGFNLIPPEAAGLWAGKMNNASYTASLKKINDAWVLLGQHTNNIALTQKIIIGQDDMSIQTQESIKTYVYKNTNDHLARFENSLDANDHVLISYVKDKLEIFQSSGNTNKEVNKPTANQWKLVKSYE